LIHRVSIKWWKRLRFAMLKNAASAGHPVGGLGVNEMPDDVERAESLRPVVVHRPLVAQSAKQRAWRWWCSCENFNRAIESECHAVIVGTTRGRGIQFNRDESSGINFGCFRQANLPGQEFARSHAELHDALHRAGDWNVQPLDLLFGEEVDRASRWSGGAGD